MADIKINDLTAYTNPVSTDVLPIVDIGNDLTKKVEIRNLLKNATGGSATAPSFSFDADPDTGMYKSGSNALAFTTAGNGRLFIDSSGNVGIGTPSPNNYANYSTLTLNDTTGSIIDLEANGTVCGELQALTNEFRINAVGSSGVLKMYAGAAERMRIDSSGNVGIGASSIGNISGYAQLVLNNSTGGLIQFEDDGSNVGRIVSTSSAFTLRTDGELVFETNGSTEAMRIGSDGSITAAGGNTVINSSGWIDITRDSAGSNGLLINQQIGGGTKNNTIKMLSNGSAEFAGSIVTDSFFRAGDNPASGGAVGAAIANTGGIQLSVSTGTQSAFRVYTQGNSSERVDILGNGSAEFAGAVTAASYVTSSDQRFKENITDASSQLADVIALGNSLRNWDWTDDAPVADKDTRFLGLVAQEAETISPGIVATIARTKNGNELTPEVVIPAVYETRTVPAVLDEEGEVVTAETTEQLLVTEEQVTPATYEQLDDSYKGIKNDVLVMKLLGAVAELSAKVAALEAG